MIKYIFVIFLILFTVSGCAKEEKIAEAPAAKPTSNLTENVTQQVETFTLTSGGDDAESNWQLEGDSADIVEDDVNLKNVRIKSKSKDSSVTMKAKTGMIRKREDKGIFKEDVVLAYDDGTTLTTDEIDWSFKSEAANAVGNVKMNTSSGSVIKCSGPLTLDYKKNIAVFNKDVSIENDKGSMSSKKMVVFFNPAKKNISRVEATGDVRLIRGNSVSMSEKAIYFIDDGKAILTGNPIVFVDQEEARKASKEL